MIALTTPTGKIGSQVLKNLLDANAAVRVIARDPAKLALEVHAKAEIVQGSMDDEQVLNRAFEGAESVFHVVAPSFAANDVMESYLRFARPACRAIRSQGVKRVVAVSALGRGTALARNAGPITACLAKDAEIERTGVDYRALWCPGFMENMLMQLQPLKHQGIFFLAASPDKKNPLVATRDIAASGTRLLLDSSWTGQGGLAVLGPEDLSFEDMAAVMTAVLGNSRTRVTAWLPPRAVPVALSVRPPRCLNDRRNASRAASWASVLACESSRLAFKPTKARWSEEQAVVLPPVNILAQSLPRARKSPASITDQKATGACPCPFQDSPSAACTSPGRNMITPPGGTSHEAPRQR